MKTTKNVVKHPLDIEASVRYLICKLGTNRLAIAKKSGVSMSTLDNIRLGKGTSTDTIARLAKAYGYTPVEFVMLSEERWITVATTGSTGQ